MSPSFQDAHHRSGNSSPIDSEDARPGQNRQPALLVPHGSSASDAGALSPRAFRRSASDEGRSRAYTEPRRPLESPLDPDQAALLQHARLKMSNQDQEAMRRLRSTMASATQSSSTPNSRRQSPTRVGSREGTVGRSRGAVLGRGARSRNGSEEVTGADEHRTPRLDAAQAVCLHAYHLIFRVVPYQCLTAVCWTDVSVIHYSCRRSTRRRQNDSHKAFY